jgi:hypothetical protein
MLLVELFLLQCKFCRRVTDNSGKRQRIESEQQSLVTQQPESASTPAAAA